LAAFRVDSDVRFPRMRHRSVIQSRQSEALQADNLGGIWIAFGMLPAA
jgi:hypothetical protein